jgi:hypothetical protein
VRFEVLKVASMKMAFFWDVALWYVVWGILMNL